MQFKLNENAKFILNEKYILLESPESDKADLESGLPTLVDNIKKIVAEVKPTVESIKKNKSSIDEVKTIGEDFTKNIKGLTGDFEIFAGKVKTYITKIKELITKAGLEEAEFPEITKALAELNTIITGTPAEGKDAEKAKLTAIDKFSELVKIVSDNLQTIKLNVDLDKLTSTITTLDNFTSDADKELNFTIAINNLKNPKIVNDDTVENLAELLLEAEAALPEELTDGAEITIDEDLVNQLTHLVEACTELLKILCNEPKAKSDLQKERDANSTKLDWKKEFAEAGTDREAMAATWKQYFETEWGANADFVKALGEPFVSELQKLGYNANLNPFISFIKICIEKHIPLNASNYAAIHNAYVNKYIDAEALYGRAMRYQLSPNANILFNKDLYSKTGGTILTYLSYQADVVAQYRGGETDALVDEKLLETYGEDLNALVTILFTGDYDILDLETDPITGRPLQGLDTIKTNIKICFGDGAVTDREVKEVASVEKLWSAMSSLDSKLKVKALQYLISTYSETNDAAQKLIKALYDAKLITADNEYKITDAPKLVWLKKKFNISPAELEKIINGLTEKLKAEAGK